MKKTDETTLAKAVGRTIAKKRQAQGFTQEEVAERLDIGLEAVSRIERGTVMPTVARLSELAEVFKCSIDELLVPASSRPIDQASHLAGLLEKLSEADRCLVVEVAEKLSIRLQKKSANPG